MGVKTRGHIFKTQKEAEAALRRWQGILRLRDWDLTVEFARCSALGTDNWGDVARDEAHKEARIRLLEPADYVAPSTGRALDHELTLVHELVHIVLGRLECPHQDEGLAEEIAVDVLAKAFLSLTRKDCEE